MWFNEYSSNIIIALITGLLSIVTLLIQQKQNRVIDKIDDRTIFIENEKRLRRQIQDKEKEKNEIINDILILILDTNVDILDKDDQSPDMRRTAEDLKRRYDSICEEISDIESQYAIVLDMSKEYNKVNPPKAKDDKK